jgi:TolB-like protein
MNIENSVVGALWAAAVLTVAGPVFSQDAAPSAPAEAGSNETAVPQSEPKKIVAVARFEDRDGAVQDAAIVVTLDTTLWSTLAGRKQSRFDVVRLDPPSPDGCGLRCALDAARAAGAVFLVRGEAQRVEDKLLATIEIVSVQTGAVMQSHRSELVTEAAFIVETTADAIRRAADSLFEAQVSQAAQKPAVVATPSGLTVSPPGAAAGTGDVGNAGDVARAMVEYRQKTLESPAFARARSRRNAGVALFVFGTIFDVVGGGLIGAGQPARKQGLVISGYVIGGTGVIMFFSGIGVWVSNQIRMNKMERGIPLGRSLRLDGLAPIVASHDLGAPGLSARFSF